MKPIQRYTIGIRYRRSFRVADISGDILDEILYGEGSVLKDRFESSSESLREKSLENSKNEYVRITTTDIIFSLKVTSLDGDPMSEIRLILPFVENIFKKFQIQNIYRVGVIFQTLEKRTKTIEEIVKKYTNQSIDMIDTGILRFSKKIKDPMVKVKKVLDYKNVIYEIACDEKNIEESLDFQKFFNPLKEDIRDAKLAGVLEEAYQYLLNENNSWLMKNGQE